MFGFDRVPVSAGRREFAAKCKLNPIGTFVSAPDDLLGGISSPTKHHDTQDVRIWLVESHAIFKKFDRSGSWHIGNAGITASLRLGVGQA